MSAISVLIQELTKLRGFSGAGFTNDNDNYLEVRSAARVQTKRTRQTLIVSDDPHQFLSAGERGQVFSLLFQSPVFGKATNTCRSLQVTSKL